METTHHIPKPIVSVSWLADLDSPEPIMMEQQHVIGQKASAKYLGSFYRQPQTYPEVTLLAETVIRDVWRWTDAICIWLQRCLDTSEVSAKKTIQRSFATDHLKSKTTTTHEKILLIIQKDLARRIHPSTNTFVNSTIQKITKIQKNRVCFPSCSFWEKNYPKLPNNRSLKKTCFGRIESLEILPHIPKAFLDTQSFRSWPIYPLACRLLYHKKFLLFTTKT